MKPLIASYGSSARKARIPCLANSGYDPPVLDLPSVDGISADTGPLISGWLDILLSFFKK